MAPSATDFDHTTQAAGLMNGADSLPEKLAMIKLRSSNFGAGSEIERPSSAHSHVGGLRGSSSRMGMRSSKTTRHSSSARRNSSFIASHRSKMASEVTMQAENKFFSLMDLMSAASKEASSLKEIWATLMADREAFDREREEMLGQIEEYSEVIENEKNDYHGHGREAEEKRKEVERLTVQLQTVMASVTEHKQKFNERGFELEGSRREVVNLQNTIASLQHNHDKLKFDLDASRTAILDRESERDVARSDADKQRNDARILLRENSELKSKVSELVSALEQSRKENVTLHDRQRTWERERADLLFDMDRVKEELRRMTSYRDEANSELHDAINRGDILQRDLLSVKESIRRVELERDEHVTTVERLRHDNNHKSTRITEIEALHAEISLKLEQTKREVTDKLERISYLDNDLSTLRSQLETKQEEWRLVIIERDTARDEAETERRKLTDQGRQITSLQDTVHRSESTISELRTESLRITETLREAERERDNARQRHGPLEQEILSIREKLTIAITESENLLNARDRAQKELEDCTYELTEVTETMGSWHDDSEELKTEIESLRTLIRDLRDQKERAISARNSADRERDDCVQRYESKCREFEALQDSHASQLESAWAASKENRQASTSRVTSKSTVMHHGGHGHGHGEDGHHHE